MKLVKLSFPYDFPVMRQTSGSAGVWGNYRFVIDDTLQECDYWVIYTAHEMKAETVCCHSKHIVFVPGEAYDTSPRFPDKFLKQFGLVITVQPQLKGKNIRYHQNANPWFIERSYDALKAMGIPAKTKLLSIVSSNKDFTEGHRLRLQFADKLKAHFGDQVDFFGRGIRDFEYKWDVTAPYQYHIAIENDEVPDWVTEKFQDPILTYTFPFYYGCPNLETYIDSAAFCRIDIRKPAEAIAIIEREISGNRYEQFLQSASAYRAKVLDQLQLFPMLSSFLDTLPDVAAKATTILPPDAFQASLFSRIKRKIIK
ncbi:MAG TPA: glycosyltransferase family 10 [Ferruginibacter sp.]|nr:glycosyltransferase family 10 [Ferruginibacter sp.]